MRVIQALLISLSMVILSSVNAHADLSDGLAAFYPFNGNANDESGNGNNGIVNGATLTTDRFGRPDSAYLFNGVDNYIDCGNASSLDITGSITVSAWIKPSSLATGRILVKRGSGGYDFDIWSNELRFSLNGYEQASKLLTGMENQWIFVAATWDSSMGVPNVKLFVNADSPSTGTFLGPIESNTQNMRIGMYYGYNAFSGSIDEVRIYNRALSEAEIRELHLRTKPKPAPGMPMLLLE